MLCYAPYYNKNGTLIKQFLRTLYKLIYKSIIHGFRKLNDLHVFILHFMWHFAYF